jgi:exopolysaccharide biosynthesis predicted pyruvyltransferase EpsI
VLPHAFTLNRPDTSAKRLEWHRSSWRVPMTPYIDVMRQQTYDGFARLFAGVRKLIFTDFPDHANVGDTSLALGTLRYLAEAGIEVLGIHSIPTLPRSVFRSRDPVYIHGGGNIAGLYPIEDQHRYLLSGQLISGTLLIQGPQTVHFASSADRDGFFEHFGRREDLKVAARDGRSKELLDELGMRAETMLMPDAVHMLGAIGAPPPVQNTVWLARTDDESAGRPLVNSLDWLRDDRLTWFGCALRWRSEPWPMISRILNPSNRRWLRIANRRLSRGVGMLSLGETIVTDRLHGMLIGLQMGRSVVAIDNNNFKLTKYADTWFGATQPDVRFASSFEDAGRLVG